MIEKKFGTRGLLRLYERVALAFVDFLFGDGDQVESFFKNILHALGFYWVHHRMAVTIWRRGKFLYLLDAPDGHRWQHYWRILHDENAGSEISLTARMATVEYTNLPTTLGLERPMSVGMRLMISYLFEPQAFPNATRDFVENQMKAGPSGRDDTIRKFCRPELERLLGELSPIEVRLRITDQKLRELLQDRLGQRLSSIAFRIMMVDIEEVTLPPELETEVAANLEMLRQSIQNYTPADLARLITARMSEGMSKGSAPYTEMNIDPILRRSMGEEPGPVIDAAPGGNLPPPQPSPPATETPPKSAPPKIRRK